MAVFMLGERIRWKRGLGIALSFVGAMIMCFDPKVLSYSHAIYFCLVAVVVMSFGQIMVRRIRGVDTFSMQAWVGVLRAPSLRMTSLAFEEGQLARATPAAGRSEES